MPQSMICPARSGRNWFRFYGPDECVCIHDVTIAVGSDAEEPVWFCFRHLRHERRSWRRIIGLDPILLADLNLVGGHCFTPRNLALDWQRIQAAESIRICHELNVVISAHEPAR